jgi:hypothetical protein
MAEKLMNISRISIWVLLFALAALFVFRTDRAYSTGHLDLGDFLEYWSAGRIFLSDGNPYSSSELLWIQQSVGLQRPSPAMIYNPPWTLLLMMPFILMPFGIARGVFLLFEIGIISVAAYWFWIKSGGSAKDCWIGLLGAFTFLPCLLALHQGQINILVLGGMVLFLWAVDRKYDFIAGFATLVISVKPHLIYLFWIFLLFWAWRFRRWRVLAGAAVSFLVSVGLIYAINPMAIGGYAYALITGSLIWMTPTMGVVLMLLTSFDLKWIRFVPMLAGCLFVIFLSARWLPKFCWDRYLNCILLISVLTTGYCWTSDYALLLPIVMLAYVRFASDPIRNWWLLAALGCIPFAIIFTAFILPNYNEIYNLWVPFALWFVDWLGNKTSNATHDISAI